MWTETERTKRETCTATSMHELRLALVAFSGLQVHFHTFTSMQAGITVLDVNRKRMLPVEVSFPLSNKAPMISKH